MIRLDLSPWHGGIQICPPLPPPPPSLPQSRSQHQGAVSERDQLRIELGKQGAHFRNRQDVVDEQIADVDKLNAIINQVRGGGGPGIRVWGFSVVWLRGAGFGVQVGGRVVDCGMWMWAS